MRKGLLQKTLLEHEAEYRKINLAYELPPMPTWVKVRVAYPSLGLYARVRFEVRGYRDLFVSTYLDVNDTAGVVGYPYFEAYPITERYGVEAKRYSYDEQSLMYKDVLRELRRKRKEELGAVK